MIWRLLAATLPALLLWVGVAAAATGRVTWIDDGDTLQVAGLGSVRLLGIDAPEHTPSERDNFLLRQGVPEPTLRRISAAARAFNIATVKGREVTLSYDGETRDRHGRTLAYVFLPDGRLLNRLLLEKGYAVVYRRFAFSRKDEFLAAEAAARQQKVGVWAK